MKTITKTLAFLGLAAVGLAGCAESNESVMAKDATGKVVQGVNPPGLDKSSKGAAQQNPGAMATPAQQEKYKKATSQ